MSSGGWGGRKSASAKARLFFSAASEQELEGRVRKDPRRDENVEGSMDVDFDETTTSRGDSDAGATSPSSVSTANAVNPRKTIGSNAAHGAGCGGSEDNWKVLSEYMSDDAEAVTETAPQRVKKRKVK